MTRILIATATALVAAGTLMSSAAQACLSCEYVPEVVRPHATSPLAYGRGQDETPHRSYGGYSARRHIARIEEVAKPKKVARIEKAEKSEKPAKIAKVSKPDKAEPVAKKVEAKAAESESSSITVASADAPAKTQAKTELKAELQPVKETAAKSTDCKKFFASVGMTLTVPCE